MKIVSLLLCLLLLTGCGAPVARNLDMLEEKVDAVEEQVETAVESVDYSAVTIGEPAPVSISEEKAVELALDHAGITPEQAEGLRVSYEIDDGIPEFEVEFFVGNTEYDYTVHAETGKILSFETDD